MLKKLRSLLAGDLDKLESRVLFLERRLRGLEQQLLALLPDAAPKARSTSRVARRSAK